LLFCSLNACLAKQAQPTYKTMKQQNIQECTAILVLT
jgi:hypothetical protein